MTGKKVNITMVTYNRLEFTRRSIAALAATAGHPYHLTVVDNGSGDGSPEALQELEREGSIHRLILNGDNRGVATAANQGWQAFDGDYYLKLDNDIVMTKTGWLRELVEVCDALPDLGAAGYNFEPVSYPAQTIAQKVVRPKAGVIGGGCIMIPRRAHDKAGFWCEDYFPYSEEDADYAFRLDLLGFKKYYMEDENAGLHLPEGKAAAISKESFQSPIDEGDANYRKEKDRHRKKYAQKGGLRRINEFLYPIGLRPLYQQIGGRFRPSLKARLYVFKKFGRWNPWKN